MLSMCMLSRDLALMQLNWLLLMRNPTVAWVCGYLRTLLSSMSALLGLNGACRHVAKPVTTAPVLNGLLKTAEVPGLARKPSLVKRLQHCLVNLSISAAPLTRSVLASTSVRDEVLPVP